MNNSLKNIFLGRNSFHWISLDYLIIERAVFHKTNQKTPDEQFLPEKQILLGAMKFFC